LQTPALTTKVPAEHERRETMQRHLSAGTYNALNHASQIIAGAPLLSRDVVDVLGGAGAAQLLARTIGRLDQGTEAYLFAVGEGATRSVQRFPMANRIRNLFRQSVLECRRGEVHCSVRGASCRVSFQDQFRTLLDRHQIAYDERYLWD
jgi:hypothetical protein